MKTKPSEADVKALAAYYMIEKARELLREPAKPCSQQQEVRTPSRHVLKTWPQYFEAIGEGRKTFEVRYNDRYFQVGDSLELREWNPENETETGRWIVCAVTYLLEGGQFGVSHRNVVMAIKPTSWSRGAVTGCPNEKLTDRTVENQKP